MAIRSRPNLPSRPVILPNVQEIIKAYAPTQHNVESSDSEMNDLYGSPLPGTHNHDPTVPTFEEKWNEIKELVNKFHQDFDIDIFIAACGDEMPVHIHATQNANLFLEHLKYRVLDGRPNSGDNASYPLDDSGAVVAKASDLSENEQEISERKETSENVLKRLLIESAQRVGFDVLNERRALMWATMPNAMIKEGVYLDNYPYKVPMPHEKRQGKAKGIQNLQTFEQKALISALRSKVNRCQFVRLPKARRGDVECSRHPLIIFAPPPPDIGGERGFRYFHNGTTDWEGHPNEKSTEPGLLNSPYSSADKQAKLKRNTNSLGAEDSEDDDDRERSRPNRVLRDNSRFARKPPLTKQNSRQVPTTLPGALDLKPSEKRRSKSATGRDDSEGWDGELESNVGEPSFKKRLRTMKSTKAKAQHQPPTSFLDLYKSRYPARKDSQHSVDDSNQHPSDVRAFPFAPNPFYPVPPHLMLPPHSMMNPFYPPFASVNKGWQQYWLGHQEKPEMVKFC